MDFTKLSEVEALEEVPEGASVLAEVNGVIKRVPGEGLGGAAAGPVFSISTAEPASLATLATEATPEYTIECSMTFDEIIEQYNDMTLGPSLLKGILEGYTTLSSVTAIAFDSAGSSCDPSSYSGTSYTAYAILIFFAMGTNMIPIYYLSDGTISTSEPTYPNSPES